MARGVIVIMGSGETAPGMTKVHRQLLARYESPDVVNLDTPYAFQLNVPQMSEKLEAYFATSLRQKVETLHLGRTEETTELDRALFTRRLSEADYVFAGPGSPSYALQQWSGLEFTDSLQRIVERGGTVCFSSAAACTLGAKTAPIYEIYKVGAQPYWLEGLDLLGRFGLGCAVIPHFDNAEGKNYDTSRCYIGEPRLAQLENELPTETSILGIDEHTALTLDFNERKLTVVGRGNAYWRQGPDRVTVLENNGSLAMDILASNDQPVTEPAHLVDTPELPTDPYELGQIALSRNTRSPAAIAELVRVANQSGDIHHDSSNALVEILVQLRDELRAKANYETADRIRGILETVGVRILDGATTTRWEFTENLNSAK